MKKIRIFTSLMIGLLLLNTTLFAQSRIKLAHLSSADLMEVMPGRDTAQKIIEDYATSLEEEIKAMYMEYQNKAESFKKNQAMMSQIVQDSKIKELQDLESRIKLFDEEAQRDLQLKQEELLKPLIDRAKVAISEVAKENNYTYVFDTSVGALLYYENSDDILALVKKKLNIK
ncbi:MAG: OmpH family outer membrane protein [Bacteroidales bacterium]|nr:OmpH family outer membrane protein [Bacteroidales bacterium]